MKSDLPKVFCDLAGRPMLAYVIETVKKLRPKMVLVVVGYKKELLMDHFKDSGVEFVVQNEQLGTGHAVLEAEDKLRDLKGEVLVLAGDVPLIKPRTLEDLLSFHREHKAAVTDLTAELPEAGNYGRVVRDQEGRITKVVEKKDASPEELELREINTGTFCFDAQALLEALKEVRPENAQKEYYLTDTIEILKDQGRPVYAFRAPDHKETLGINTKEQLKELEEHLRSS